jgi:O-acetyl-ADP-ribose deacetylase (regulator of RNase III)
MTLITRDAHDVTNDIARWLLNESGGSGLVVPHETSERRTLIKKLLTVRPPQPIPDDVKQRLDVMFAQDAAHRGVIAVGEVLASAGPTVRVGGTAVKVWLGDITTLAADAIVNAANSALLGCFQPFHACIDNAIHSAAGPQLRADCAEIMTLQGHAEPTGTAKITRGYHLPARYVLHTVGPIVPGGIVKPEHQADLVRSYQACLDVAAGTPDVRSIAFCAISTGVFGYPKVAAAVVATDTVKTWLLEHPGRFDAVIFDVFSANDAAAYRATELFVC